MKLSKDLMYVNYPIVNCRCISKFKFVRAWVICFSSTKVVHAEMIQGKKNVIAWAVLFCISISNIETNIQANNVITRTIDIRFISYLWVTIYVIFYAFTQNIVNISQFFLHHFFYVTKKSTSFHKQKISKN